MAETGAELSHLPPMGADFRRLAASLTADRGREGFRLPSLEPYVRFSRIRLSSRWFPHRECLADCQAVFIANSPAAAKKASDKAPSRKHDRRLPAGIFVAANAETMTI